MTNQAPAPPVPITMVDIEDLYPDVIAKIRGMTGMPIQGRLQKTIYDGMRYAYDGILRMDAYRFAMKLTTTNEPDVDVNSPEFNSFDPETIEQGITINGDTSNITVKNKTDVIQVGIYNKFQNLPFVRNILSSMMACRMIMSDGTRYGASQLVITNAEISLEQLKKQCYITIT